MRERKQVLVQTEQSKAQLACMTLHIHRCNCGLIGFNLSPALSHLFMLLSIWPQSTATQVDNQCTLVPSGEIIIKTHQRSFQLQKKAPLLLLHECQSKYIQLCIQRSHLLQGSFIHLTWPRYTCTHNIFCKSNLVSSYIYIKQNLSPIFTQDI